MQTAKKNSKNSKATIKHSYFRRTSRTDEIIYLEQQYEGTIHEKPLDYNRAAANILRLLADKLEKVKDAWVDPQITIWLHQQGRITAAMRRASR